MVTAAAKKLPTPAFYKAKNAEDWSYDPNLSALAGEAETWARKHNVKASGTEKAKIHMLLIDAQKDFCFPQGSLFVAGRSGDGAIEDSKRTAEFIYHNLNVLTDITCTLDTHLPYQIFYPSFWHDKDGNPLTPFREITAEQVKAGEVKPNPAVAPLVCGGDYGWLMSYVRHYCETLEKAGKYKLYLWPYHCILGSQGHVLVGVIEEARMFHAWVRKSANVPEVKGGHPLTENYSVFSPEVRTRHDGKPLGAQANTALIKKLVENDAIIIAGQAASHCVKASIEDFLGAINQQDPKLIKKVYILKDCMSAVTVPNPKGGFFADFTDEAAKALKMFEDAGMHVVESTTPIEDWDGINL